jgi:hypothetical protein
MELVHVFVLFVFIKDRKVSEDMYFYDIDECIYFAQRLHKQGQRITSYCLPRQVRPNGLRIY